MTYTLRIVNTPYRASTQPTNKGVTMNKPLPAHVVRDRVNVAFRAFESACEQHNMEALFRRLERVAAQGERDHLAFGTRLLGRRPRRKQSVSVAARYFVVKAISEACNGRSDTIADLAWLREDYQIGAIIGHALHVKGFDLDRGDEFRELDYTEHFAEKG